MSRSLVRGTLPALVVGASLAGYASHAAAGDPGADCRHPYVFSEGTVNLVVLPYEYHSARGGASASSTSREIPLLVQANGLLQMLRYGSVGSLNMVNPYDDPRCRPEVVKDAVLSGPFHHGQVRPGHGLILVWGTLYEEGDEFQVQTFMSILRRDRQESFAVPLSSGDSMVVQPSTTTLAFAPQTLTRADLERVRAAFQEASEVRRAPSPTAPLAPFTFYDPNGSGLGYEVVQAQGGWLLVRDRTGRSGWILADFTWGPDALSARLPEVGFISVAAGYLRARIAAERPGDRAPPRTLPWIRDALNRYLNDAGPEGDEVAGAVGRQLLALAACALAPVTPQVRALADTSAARAAEALPNDAEAQRLAGAMTLWADWGNGEVARRGSLVERRLARAALVGGEKNAGLRDLMTLYKLTLSGAASGHEGPGRIRGAVAEVRLHALDRDMGPENVTPRRPPEPQRHK